MESTVIFAIPPEDGVYYVSINKPNIVVSIPTELKCKQEDVRYVHADSIEDAKNKCQEFWINHSKP